MSLNINTDNNDTWLTPPELIKSLGVFDLDPACPVNMPWKTAKHHYTKEDDGLLMPWYGRVWCNPPYGKFMGMFMHKLALHGNGIGLVFARTETKAFQEYVFPFAESIMFLNGRIYFHHIDGRRAKHNSGTSSVLVSYGEENADAIESSGLKGHHVYLRNKVFVIGLTKEPSTWRLIVEEALIELNGESNLSDIYEKVISIAPKRVNKNQFFREKVKQTLGRYFTRIKTGTYKVAS